MAVDYSVQIAALKEAIASGATTVSVEGKSVSYRSLKDMIQAVAYLERQQDKANGKGQPTAGYAGFSRGYTTRLPGYRTCR